MTCQVANPLKHRVTISKIQKRRKEQEMKKQMAEKN